MDTLCWPMELDFTVLRLFLPMIPIWESLAKRTHLVVCLDVNKSRQLRSINLGIALITLEGSRYILK